MHWVPRITISDDGPCFKANKFEEKCYQLGIHLSHVTPYYHQANGLIERWNRTLASMIRPLAEEHREDWDRLIGYCLFAYRTTVHPSTGNIPFFLLHGRDPALPGEA